MSAAAHRLAFFADVADDLERVLALPDLTAEERATYEEARSIARARVAELTGAAR